MHKTIVYRDSWKWIYKYVSLTGLWFIGRISGLSVTEKYACGIKQKEEGIMSICTRRAASVLPDRSPLEFRVIGLVSTSVGNLGHARWYAWNCLPVRPWPVITPELSLFSIQRNSQRFVIFSFLYFFSFFFFFFNRSLSITIPRVSTRRESGSSNHSEKINQSAIFS